MTISFTKALISEEEWQNYISSSKTEEANHLLEDGTPFFRINTEEKIVTIREDLSLTEKISAFFQLIFLEIFNTDTEINKILPEAWHAFWDGKKIQYLTYIPSSSWDLELLPLELQTHLLSFLPLSDLQSFIRTKREIPAIPSVLQEYARRLNRPLAENKPLMPQVMTFTAELQERASFVLKDALKDDVFKLSEPCLEKIRELILSQEIEDLINLNEALKGRDAHILWIEFSNYNAGVKFPMPAQFQTRNTLTFEELLTIPDRFEEWCVANKEPLSKKTELQLLHLDLTSLPTQIKYVPNLDYLLLYNNFIMDLPKEIWDLKELTTLTLWCKLKEISSEIGKLTKLEELTIYNNRLTSIPKEVFEIDSLEDLRLEKYLANSVIPMAVVGLAVLGSPGGLSSSFFSFERWHLKMLRWIVFMNNLRECSKT